jgi:Flp pilus assembly protein TadG
VASQHGQTTVELALCLPIVLLVLAAVVEIGLIAGDQIRLWHAAREAARVAVVEPDPATAVKAAEAAGFETVDVSISPEVPRRKAGSPLTVALSFDRPGVVPLVGKLFEAVELTSEATMRIERP